MPQTLACCFPAGELGDGTGAVKTGGYLAFVYTFSMRNKDLERPARRWFWPCLAGLSAGRETGFRFASERWQGGRSVKWLTALASCLLACFCLLVPVHAAEPTPMDQLRAAYLYQFTKFVGWNQPSRDNLVIALVGDAPLRGAEETIIGKRSQGRVIEVISLGADLKPGNGNCCDVIYGSMGDLANLRLASSEWFGDGVLVVSDGDTGADPEADSGRWWMIRMYEDGNKLRFDVDLDLATRSGLALGSELLKNAGTVHIGAKTP